MSDFISCVLAIPMSVYLFSGVSSDNYLSAAIFGAVLGIIHLTIRPVLKAILKIFNWLTLGALFLAIDVALVYASSLILPDKIYIESFWWILAITFLIYVLRRLIKIFFK